MRDERQLVHAQDGTREALIRARSRGKFVAVDCEMVGIGPDGKASSLAWVSVVNFHGVVPLDEFVRQRERVVDYQTEYSGIRPGELILRAKPFAVVQKQVARGGSLLGMC